MSYYLRTAKLIMDNFGNLSRPQQHQLNNSNASTVLRLCFIDALVGAPADTPEGGKEARTPKHTVFPVHAGVIATGRNIPHFIRLFPACGGIPLRLSPRCEPLSP